MVQVERQREALDVVDAIPYEPDRSLALLSIVERLTQMAEFDSALRTAQRIADDHWRDRALSRIGAALIGVGSFDGASCLLGIKDDASRDRALSDLVRALLESGHPAKALDYIVAISNKQPLLELLAETADRLIAAGAKQALRRFVGSARQAVNMRNEALHEWHRALTEYSPPALTDLRETLLYCTFSSEMAFDGVRALHLAHIRAGRRDTSDAINRQCPQLGLEFLLKAH
jgi:hypothetical protein